MKPHTRALQSFARKLSLLLMFRGAVRWTTIWFFVWGVVVLAARISGAANNRALLIGLLGVIPLAAIVAIREHRRRASFTKVRATYDQFNQCGGMIMAEEVADMSAWQATLPQSSTPALRWRGGRSFGLLGLSAAFVAVTLYLPIRLTALTGPRPLEIGQLVGELRAEVQTLSQEKIIEPKQAEDLQKQLAKLKEQSSGLDPNKTWEALDHMKEANSDLARQAAEEALSKLNSLTEAQTLASALEQAAEAGLGKDTATQAARDVAAMLKAAKLDEGLLKGQISQQLLSQLNGLSKEDMERLLASIQFNKNALGKTVTNLSNLKLIDPKLLSQCRNAGECKNPNALAAFLCNSTNCNSFCSVTTSYCRGGIDRGRGDAPMTWKDQSSDQDTKFKEHALPASSQLSDSQTIGVSRAAPDLSGEDVVAAHGALVSAQGSGGGANAQVILPEHRQAVQKFFKREEK